ncbi:MAG: universal stress protein [Saprospiraceae bacterium]
MLKILVPIDFSESSKKALSYALTLGEKTKINVYMLHVTTVPSRSGTKLIHKMRELAKDEDRSMVDSQTNTFISGIKGISDLNQITIIRYGDVSKQIINVSLQEDFDLIVMGTKGVSRIKEAFMGSNTYSTLKLSMIPTIVVPMVYDANKTTKKACIALRVNKLYGNMCAKLLEKSILLGYEPELMTVVDNKSDELALTVKMQRKSYPIYMAKNPRPRRAILEYITANNSGILALNFNAYSFFKELTYHSVSSEFTFRSKIPILFMR